MKNFIAFILGSLISTLGFSQDIHFSQYFNSPLTTAPSNTGNYTGDWRIMSIYRSQWKQIDKPYITQSIGFDKQIYIHNEKISLGGIIIDDKSAGALKVNKFFLSAGYHKELGPHQLHFGLQPGFVSKRFVPESETYPNQFNWDAGSFDNTLPNNETGLTGSEGYLDINAGLGYSVKMNKIEPYFNLSAFHINSPKESFFGNNEKLKPRTLINGGLNIFAGKFEFQPSFLLMGTTKATEAAFGTNILFNFSKDLAFYIGFYNRDGMKRISDAVYGVLGAKYKRYAIAASYDYNYSPLHIATDYKGAFEISFIYTALSTRLIKTEIPCDRY